MPRRFHAALAALPLVPVLVGLALSAWRFRVGDDWGGLAFGEAGMILMIVVAIRMPASGGDEKR